MHQDRAAGGIVAGPYRAGQIDEVMTEPVVPLPPLVFRKAAREVTRQQSGGGEVPMRLDEVRTQGDGRVARIDRVRQTAARGQHEAEAGMRLDQRWVAMQGACECSALAASRSSRSAQALPRLRNDGACDGSNVTARCSASRAACGWPRAFSAGTVCEVQLGVVGPRGQRRVGGLQCAARFTRRQQGPHQVDARAIVFWLGCDGRGQQLGCRRRMAGASNTKPCT